MRLATFSMSSHFFSKSRERTRGSVFSKASLNELAKPIRSFVSFKLTGNRLCLAVKHLILVGDDWRDTGERLCRTGWDTSCVPAHSTTLQSGPWDQFSKTSAESIARLPTRLLSLYDRIWWTSNLFLNDTPVVKWRFPEKWQPSGRPGNPTVTPVFM